MSAAVSNVSNKIAAFEEKGIKKTEGDLNTHKVSVWSNITNWIYDHRKAIATAFLIIGLTAATIGAGLSIAMLSGTSPLVNVTGVFEIGFSTVDVAASAFLTASGIKLIAGALIFGVGGVLSCTCIGYLLGTSHNKDN
jgi:hypothetical protein